MSSKNKPILGALSIIGKDSNGRKIIVPSESLSRIDRNIVRYSVWKKVRNIFRKRIIKNLTFTKCKIEVFNYMNEVNEILKPLRYGRPKL